MFMDRILEVWTLCWTVLEVWTLCWTVVWTKQRKSKWEEGYRGQVVKTSGWQSFDCRSNPTPHDQAWDAIAVLTAEYIVKDFFTSNSSKNVSSDDIFTSPARWFKITPRTASCHCNSFSNIQTPVILPESNQKILFIGGKQRESCIQLICILLESHRWEGWHCSRAEPGTPPLAQWQSAARRKGFSVITRTSTALNNTRNKLREFVGYG